MKTNITYAAEKRKKFFSLSRKQNSFSKSAYSKNFAEKNDIFRKFFLSKTFAKNASNEPQRISVRHELVPVTISKEEHFWGGRVALLENKILYYLSDKMVKFNTSFNLLKKAIKKCRKVVKPHIKTINGFFDARTNFTKWSQWRKNSKFSDVSWFCWSGLTIEGGFQRGFLP